MIRALRALFLRVCGLRVSDRFEREMAEELASALQDMTEDGVRAGLSHEEAKRAALVKLGGLEQTAQAVRDRRTIPLIEMFVRDCRFAARQLRMRPGFTATAVLMLAVGFGSSVAIFSFLDAALIRPLPYFEPNRLLWVTELVDKMGPANLSWQDYQDWQGSATSFESFAVWRYAGNLVKTGDGLKPEPAMRVSANFLETLGVQPALGRNFRAAENAPGAEHVAILSYSLWQENFGGREGVVGQPVELDGQPYTIVGVLPKSFEFAPRGITRILTPVRPETGSCEIRRSCHSLNGVARLRGGVTLARADAEVKRIAAVLEQQYPASNRGQGGFAAPLTEQATGKIRPILYTLFSGSILLFLIACLNVANLLLARSESRMREIALRNALGATRMRLLRQFAVESALLVAAGIAAGLSGAVLTMRLLMLLVPADMRARLPFFSAVHLGMHTLLFALLEATLAGVIFAVVPAARLSLSRLREALGSSTRGGGSLSWRRIGSQIVVLEMATAVVLLVSAGLLTQSMVHLLRVDLAFDPTHLATFSVTAPDSRFATDEQKIAIQRQIAERLRAMPGVISVGFGDLLPASFNGNTDWIRFLGKPYNGIHNEVNERTASPEYFETLRAKLLHGRFLTPDDALGKLRVVIVNRKFAQQYYPGEDPIGKRFGDTDLSLGSIRQIVGVVDDVHEGAIDDAIWPAEYEPAYQQVDGGASYVVRVAGDERAMLPSLVSTVRGVNPELGVSDEVTMEDRIHDSQSATLHRGAAWLVGAFAIVSMILCALGLYGVVMYSVSLRTRELGVRIALGSPRKAIYQLVLKEAGLLSAAGIVLGLLLAVGAATLLRTVLFQVAAWDLPTLSFVVFILAACSLLASYLPAHRAAMVDPVDALRAE